MKVIIMNKPNEENIQYVTNSYFFIDFGGGGWEVQEVKTLINLICKLHYA